MRLGLLRSLSRGMPRRPGDFGRDDCPRDSISAKRPQNLQDHSRILARAVERVAIPSITKPTAAPRCATLTKDTGRRASLDIILTTGPLWPLVCSRARDPRNRLPQTPSTSIHLALHHRRRSTDRMTPSRRRILSRHIARFMLDDRIRRIRTRERQQRSLCSCRRMTGTAIRKGTASTAESVVVSRGGKGGREACFRVMVFYVLMALWVSRGG